MSEGGSGVDKGYWGKKRLVKNVPVHKEKKTTSLPEHKAGLALRRK